MTIPSQEFLHKSLYELITGTSLAPDAEITIYDVEDNPHMPTNPTVFGINGIIYAVAIQEELDCLLPMHLAISAMEVLFSQVIDRDALRGMKPVPFPKLKLYALYTGKGKAGKDTLRITDAIPDSMMDAVVTVIDTDCYEESLAPSLSQGFWDCECDVGYFRPNNLDKCPDCGTLQEDMPSSHENEIYAYLISHIEAFYSTHQA